MNTYMDSKTENGITTTIQIERNVTSVSEGLVTYTFKYSIFPEKQADIPNITRSICEVSFRARAEGMPDDQYMKPEDNIIVVNDSEDDSTITESIATGDYLGAIGQLGTLISFSSTINPITTIFPVLAKLVKKDRTVVGTASYVKYEDKRLIFGVYRDAHADKNPTVVGTHSVSVELKCSTTITFMMPDTVSVITSVNNSQQTALFTMNKANKDQIITRFKNFTTSKIISGGGLPAHSIVFICESGAYISRNKLEGNSLPLPLDFGYLIGTICEKVIDHGSGWKSDRLYHQSSKLTLVKVPFNGVDFQKPLIDHI